MSRWPAVSSRDRFLSKVSQDATECWLWTASTNKSGYGIFKVDRRVVLAHRWAYTQFVGPIPEGLQLDHLCRVRHCVNPAHLEPVTCAENFRRGHSPTAVSVRTGLCARGLHLLPVELNNGPARTCTVCRAERERRRYRERMKELTGVPA